MGWLRSSVGLILVLFATAVPVRAQDTLLHLRELYASAAYDEALTMVGRLATGEIDPEAEQYRVFCLVALGKPEEAERAAEAVIRARPGYRPETPDVSPRIQELFSRVRRRLGPSLVKAMYVDAKAALDRKDRDGAIARFEEMLRLADDPDVKDEASISELRFLGAGFLDLSRALPAPARVPPPAPTPSPAPTAAAAQPVVEPPLAVREALPPWVPTDAASRFAEYRGAVRVQIDVDGKVSAAELVSSVHPVYDRLLLQAARDWRYQPARMNGAPVPSEKIVQVVLKPR
jgi:TonB family protein